MSVGILKQGDRVVVLLEHDEFEGLCGTFTGLTKDGLVLVRLDGTNWTVPFHPKDVDLADERE